MSNMSYCRFRNTNSDLSDCIEALQYREISSNEEKRAAKSLFVSFLDLCEDEGIIDGYNEATIDALIGKCKDEDEDEDDDDDSE